MKDAKTVVANRVAIAEFRIEDLAGGGFRVFFRRQLGGESLFVFVGLLVFVGLGAALMSSFLGAAWRGLMSGDAKKGPPVCCLPFVLGFFALWLSVPLRGLWAHWRGTVGREEWSFGSECVTPPKDVLNDSAPLPVGGREVRAGVSQIKGRWVVGMTAGDAELIVGPFRTEAVARAFEGELRKRRPGWFEGLAAGAYGVVAERATERLEPVTSCEVLPGAGGGFDVVMRRESSAARRLGTAFMAFWLCGWTAGELTVSTVLARHFFLGVPIAAARPGKGPPAVGFMVVWLTGWTVAGVFAWGKVVLHLRRRERWRFENGRVVAGRNWVHPWRRVLVDDGRTVVRVVGKEVELVSGGVALRMGPFAGENGAQRLAEELERLRV
jgi:hypothetical protein